MDTNNPKKLLEYITLPQCVMAVFLALSFIQVGEYPSPGLIVVFSSQLLFNIAAVMYYIHRKPQGGMGIKALYAFLASLIIIFSCAVYMIFEEFSSYSVPSSVPSHFVVSPETLYLLCNSVSLIFLSAEIIKKNYPEKNTGISSLIMVCLALPVTVYLLLQSSYKFADVSIVLAIGLFCTFLFLLGKLGFILYGKLEKPKLAEVTEQENASAYSHKYLTFIGIAAVVLPQAGLLVNYGLSQSDEGLLGDFSSPWFYIIAAINGLVLLVDIGKIKYRLILFYLKAVGFAFISYFALIFIPYMPLAVIAILFYGLGLLVYVPAVVFVVQTKQLYRDYKLLKNTCPTSIIAITAVVGFLTLPALFVVDTFIDRANFNNALSYALDNHGTQQKVDFGRLKRSISQIDDTMQSTRREAGLSLMPGTPIISGVYRYIALDNKYFTEDTLSRLEKIFMPETVVSLSEIMLSEDEASPGYSTKLSISQMEYDDVSGAYKAWIDFEVTQLNNDWLGEYRTKFAIPDGCFITDYYLYVGNEKKRGIITDKRAAQAAYESIIRTPKDPGILYYENDNTVSLRVYPFSGNETRKTGFQIMYSQNETLLIEGQTIELVAENPVKEPIVIGGVHFIPLEHKKKLPSMERKPLYYFLLDAGNPDSYSNNLEVAKRYSEDKGINSKYYAVSYQAGEVTDITSYIPTVQSKGGFNTAYAMGEIFPAVPEGHFPIIVLVTENINRAVALEKTRLTTAFPELDCYYRLNEDFSLTPYRFSDYGRLPEVKEPKITEALNYSGIAVGSGTNETLISNSDFADFTGNQYMDAFVLQKNTYLLSDSLLADANEKQIAFIKESIKRRLLTKNTSFIVMETREQEDMLLLLQKQFLNGETAETPSVMMSEPGWAVVIALQGIIIFGKIAKAKFLTRYN